MIRYLYRIVRKIKRVLFFYTENGITRIILAGNGVRYGSNMRSSGIPRVDVSRTGKLSIGNFFSMNNGGIYNMIGRQQPCYFIIIGSGRLTIGDHVGMSATALICTCEISIGDNVKIGGNTVIYDTDFHSLDPVIRRDPKQDIAHRKSLPVHIEEDVFIGAHTTILKGVRIGKGAIIGAGSVVTKSIPSNEIWGGNPAKFVKRNDS